MVVMGWSAECEKTGLALDPTEGGGRAPGGGTSREGGGGGLDP